MLRSPFITRPDQYLIRAAGEQGWRLVNLGTKG